MLLLLLLVEPQTLESLFDERNVLERSLLRTGLYFLAQSTPQDLNQQKLDGALQELGHGTLEMVL